MSSEENEAYKNIVAALKALIKEREKEIARQKLEIADLRQVKLDFHAN